MAGPATTYEDGALALLHTQLATIDLDRQTIEHLGEPAIVGDLAVSPDGRYALVHRLTPVEDGDTARMPTRTVEFVERGWWARVQSADERRRRNPSCTGAVRP